MPKTWDELTPEEKIEDLRRDVVRLFRSLNATDNSLRNIAIHLEQTTMTATEAAAAVSALRVQLASAFSKDAPRTLEQLVEESYRLEGQT